jgi:hypothetical protein
MHMDLSEATASRQGIITNVLQAMFPPSILAGLVLERIPEERKQMLESVRIQPIYLQRFDGLRAVIRSKNLYKKKSFKILIHSLTFVGAVDRAMALEGLTWTSERPYEEALSKVIRYLAKKNTPKGQ